MKKNNILFSNQHGRKNHFNQSYFNSIDHQNKAYWLGFIYADGSVTNTGGGNTKTNRLTINISNKDIELLKSFCNDIELDSSCITTYKPKNTYSTHEMCRVYLNSIELCHNLEMLGVVQNKTCFLSSIPDIPSDMLPHFIRGFFDGDGWIQTKNNLLGFIGNNELLQQINSTLVNTLNIPNGYITKENRKNFPIYYLRYYKKSSIKSIYNYLYKNAIHFLDRKHDIIKNK